MEEGMPNWCSNHLTVKGEHAEVQRFKVQAVGHSPWETPPVDEEPAALNFHSLVPVPADVLQAGYENAGYDWELNNWGCKWGACSADLVEDNGHELLYGFDSAWSPPIAFLKHLGKLWPNLMFLLEYDEPDMGLSGSYKVQGNHYEVIVSSFD
jgi:hypothetical protein